MKGESLLQQLQHAINTHDLDEFVKCFATDYNSEQPAHPDRTFKGREQVRKNWSANFNEMADFHAELLRYETSDNTAWGEWQWNGTRQDKSQLNMRGVTIFGIENNKIKWGRLYMEPVETKGGGIDASIREVMQGKKN